MRYRTPSAVALGLYAMTFLSACVSAASMDKMSYEMREKVSEEAQVIDSRLDERLRNTAEKVSAEIRKESAEMRRCIDRLRELVEKDVGDFKERLERLEEMLKKYETLVNRVEKYFPKENDN